MKRSFLTLAVAGVLGLAAITPASAEMTKADVEAIVKDYIMNNGDVILQSVTDYQTKGMVEKQKQAMAANQREIFASPIAPVAGDSDGDVRVVEFFDYNCGYCKRVVGDVMKLIEEDKDIQVIFKEFPILGPTSETAARWALAVAKVDKDKYVDFHNALLNSPDRVSDSMLETIAKSLDIDVEKVKETADSQDITDHIAENRKLAQELGISGTPAFVIEDEIFPGAIGYDAMTAAVAAKRAADDSAE